MNSSLLVECLEPLLAEGVELIVVGGQAEGLLGSARVIFDVDLCYRRTAENLERLARLGNSEANIARSAAGFAFSARRQVTRAGQ